MRQMFFNALTWAKVIVFAALLPLQAAYCAEASVALDAESVRPNAEGGPTVVAVGVWIVDITRIDSVSQTFSANVVLVMSWRDPALAHKQVGRVRYPLEAIWHPNWLVANADQPVDRTLPEIVEVESDGTVSYRQRIIGTFSQALDLYAFPFDRGTFTIQLGMIGQKPNEIAFVANPLMVKAGFPTGVGVAPQLTLKDWRITGFSGAAAPYRVAPGIEIAGYQFEFQAERLTAHYIIKIIIPLLLIVMMSWSTFWIDPSLGGSQISVATTSMLTLIAYRFAVGNEVPKLPYLTHLDKFILASSVLVLLTLIEVIATNTLARDDRLELARKIDRYSRIVFPIAYALVFAVTLAN
jgi:neurotransmitter-gated ion-channel